MHEREPIIFTQSETVWKTKTETSNILKFILKELRPT